MTHKYEYVKQVVESKDGYLISEKYTNSRAKLDIICNVCLYEWFPTFHDILKGTWCPNCSGVPRFDIEYVRSEIEKRDGYLLSTEYKDSRTPLDIICNKCHTLWHPCFYSITSNGSWCPSLECCGVKTIPYTFEFVKQTIENKDGYLLSAEYKNCQTKLDVICNKCHNVWHPTFHKIVVGHWCIYCAGNKYLGHDFVAKIIEDKDGHLLSRYKNVGTKMDVRCNRCKNIWRPTFNHILKGRWCPVCKNKKELEVYSIAKQLFPSYETFYQYSDFDWLAGAGKARQRFDIYIKGLGLVIEYNGSQHYFPVRFGGVSLEKAQQMFEYTTKMDEEKRKKILCHPEDVKHLIIIPYTEKITPENIARILRMNSAVIDESLVTNCKPFKRSDLDEELNKIRKVNRRAASRKYAAKKRLEKKMIYSEKDEKWIQICKLDDDNDLCFTDEYVSLMKDTGQTRTFAARLITWFGIENVQTILNYFGPEDEETDKFDGIDTHKMALDPNLCELMDYKDTALPGLDADWYNDFLAAKLVSIKLPERVIKQYVKAAKRKQ